MAKFTFEAVMTRLMTNYVRDFIQGLRPWHVYVLNCPQNEMKTETKLFRNCFFHSC